MPGPRRLLTLLSLPLLVVVFGGGLAHAAQKLHVDLMETSDGRMVLKTAVNTVKPGKVTFDVTNRSKDIEHEFLVAPLKVAREKVPYNQKQDTVKEEALKGLVELGDLEPGKSGTMTLDLKAGKYLLFCNKPGHFKAGMSSVLTVAP